MGVAAAYWETAAAVLTAKQLRLVELRDRHGFSLRQTALATGVSVSTVRTQLHRADQKLNLAKEAA